MAALAPLLALWAASPTDGLDVLPWPGSQTVSPADVAGQLGGDISGLDYEAPGVLWAVDNGDGLLLRLVPDNGVWTRERTKTLKYPGGTGKPDAEGVTLTDAGAAGGVFVSTERDGESGAVSRMSVLRYDVTPGDGALSAAQEWNLTADLPVVGANSGLESVTWVPDAALVAGGFLDDAAGGVAYNPATYPDHGSGLFLVGLEASGAVYAYALKGDGTFTRITTFASGFPTFAGLHWETSSKRLFVACDDNCGGQINVLGLEAGRFVEKVAYARPTGMPNLNNEGFTIAPDSACAADAKPVFWADDGNTDAHALRVGSIACPSVAPTATPTATATPVVTASPTPSPTVTPPRPCKVPDVVGRRLAKAKRRIRAAGCTVGKVKRPKRAGTKVGRQRPKAGRSVDRGTAVKLTLKKRG